MSNNINSEGMLRVGTILRGTYRIDGYLSSGGFGNTYVVTNIAFDERRALKEFFMRDSCVRDANGTTVSVSTATGKATFQSQLQKFKKEAQRLRRLNNPHIVHVHDLFEENGTAYYVMDYIEGENLSERLKRTNTAMSETEVTQILPQVLDALETIHNAGFTHLDLKPANIMIDRDGTVKLIDFGASKQQRPDGHGATSNTTSIAYTPGYAPSEQMEQNLERFGPWTDFYALGATLYTLLTNRKPPSPSVINEDTTPDKYVALPMPASISPQTRRLVLWLMRTNRMERPQSVAEIRSRLSGGMQPVETPESEETIINNPAPKPARPKPVEVPTVEKKKEKGRVKKTLPAIIVAVAVAILCSVFPPSHWFSGSSSRPAATDSTEVGSSGERGHVDRIKTMVGQGECTYSGEVNENGIPNGMGEAWFADGRYYKGHFKNGIMEDSAAEMLLNNGDTYKGSFVNDHFDRGTYTIKDDGSYFMGTFDEKGQPKAGTWLDKKGREIPQ